MSSSAELMTASAPTARAFSSRAGWMSMTTTWEAPLRLKPIAAPSPIGPAPKTANSIAWLLSDDAANVNGVILPSDGGWSAV